MAGAAGAAFQGIQSGDENKKGEGSAAHLADF